jgi:hypothetical protein
MMYSFESSGSRKPLHAMVIGALVGAAVFFSVGTLPSIPLPSLFQMGAIVCATLAVYLTARYSLRAYRYAIEPNTIVDAEGVEQYDLVITEITGKKMKVVCRVGLRTVDHDCVTVIRRADGQASKEARDLLCKDKRVFKYENTPVSPASCYIPIPEENSVVVIPADERMVEILRAR